MPGAVVVLMVTPSRWLAQNGPNVGVVAEVEVEPFDDGAPNRVALVAPQRVHLPVVAAVHVDERLRAAAMFHVASVVGRAPNSSLVPIEVSSGAVL